MMKKYEQEEPEFDCIHCQDTGFVTKKFFDRETGHWMDDGEEECGFCGRGDEYDDGLGLDDFMYGEEAE